MRNNRNAGNSYERDLMNEFRELFPNILTSRNASRVMDALKVDFVNTAPFNIQAKYTQNYPNFYELLNEMPQDTNYNIVVHKKNKGKGSAKNEIVVMTKQDFIEILKLFFRENIFKN